MTKKIKCNSQSLVDSLEAIDNNADKVSHMDIIINTCGKGATKTVPRKKRDPNSWNCYLKACAETGMPFSECMTDSPRKEKEYVAKKDYWIAQAKKGC